MISLTDTQQKRYNEWIAALRVIYGKVGHITWHISNTGIGPIIKVSSDLVDTELDLTDVDSW